MTTRPTNIAVGTEWPELGLVCAGLNPVRWRRSVRAPKHTALADPHADGRTSDLWTDPADKHLHIFVPNEGWRDMAPPRTPAYFTGETAPEFLIDGDRWSPPEMNGAEIVWQNNDWTQP